MKNKRRIAIERAFKLAGFQVSEAEALLSVKLNRRRDHPRGKPVRIMSDLYIRGAIHELRAWRTTEDALASQLQELERDARQAELRAKMRAHPTVERVDQGAFTFP